MKSSYWKNNFGEVLFYTTIAFPPALAVELGVLEGFSSISIGKALCWISERKGICGHLHSYDLWEDYPHKHTTMEKTQETINLCGIEDFVTLYKMDAYEVSKLYKDRTVDLLHVDISNDGETFERILELWDPKMRHCGLILFEGGSEERDNVEWMKKYNKKKIRPAMNGSRLLNENYIWGTYSAFPSLTVMKKVTL